LRRLALARTGNYHDAEDAVQEAFLRAYRNAPNFAGRSTLSTWLYRILINVCHDVGRCRRQVCKHLGGSDGAEANVCAAVAMADPLLRLSLEKMLHRLAPHHRMILLMAAVEGLKHSEIAAILRIPERTSKTRLFQAKRQLRRMFS
jgi:RNA polymerase sigma-70 factor (ECF subfamily)